LIGSPPGYVNHEEGGQLTKPLEQNPQRVVLLDEIEKAHPQVIKVFLPVFDEALILDEKNNRISCAETIFIMTSNLCGEEIARLYNSGKSTEAILDAIEPTLIQTLSPEIYNRVEPVLFRPLAKKTMGALVDLMLNKIKDNVLVEKKIHLHFDNSLRNFLIEHGHHPLLGARPLKKLIQKEVLAVLSSHLIKNKFENGSEILLVYDRVSESVKIRPYSS
jgi:ATP-dependent Clp protease ATP-binding subunit ClpA